MNDEAALLAAIAAQPDEDTPRLVYADWLDEQPTGESVPCPECDGTGEIRGAGMFASGKPCLSCGGVALTMCSHRKGKGVIPDTANRDRAEFIRVQCRIADRDLERPGGSTAVPTHRCTTCRALWVLWPENHALPIAHPCRPGSWSLCSASCGKCCDNAPMGEQIESLSEEDRSLVSREWELLSANGREWANGVIPEAAPSNWSPHDPTPYLVLPGPSFVNIAFRRGFVESVTCPAADWLAHGDAIRAAHPVTRLVLTTIPLSTLAAPGWGLIGDPTGVFFMDTEVSAEIEAEMLRNTGSVSINGQWLRALCRLRWKGLTVSFGGAA